jgi:PPOX class probable F420-dependent enzyme
MTSDDDTFEALLAAHRRGVLVTLKRDGRPQLSNVGYAYDARPRRRLRISVTAGRAKTANMRRDPRVSFYVTRPALSAYVVAEGMAALGEVAADPHDAAVDALVEHYREVRGEHDDWDEFRAAMVDERRLLLTIDVTYWYGWVPSAP